jgi:hypothetical protein
MRRQQKIKKSSSRNQLTAILGIIKVTVRDSAGRKVSMKRVKRGSKRELVLDTTGLKGPVTLSATLSQVG